jgi:DNA repair exonuclease SbcCD ATPase subunit
LESIITDKSVQVQNLNSQIRNKEESLEAIKSECRREAALLEGLRQQTAKVQAFVYNYKNNNEEHIEVIFKCRFVYLFGNYINFLSSIVDYYER